MGKKVLRIKLINKSTEFRHIVLPVISGGIIGVSKVSGMRILNEIHNSFYNYDDIKKIFKLEDNGLKIHTITSVELEKAIRGKNIDVRSLAYAYFLTANSRTSFYVDMSFSYETLNIRSIDALHIPQKSKGLYADIQYGGGVNTISNGAIYTVVIMDSKVDVGDFTYAPNGVNYPRHSTPAELLSHEMLGHGYGRSIGSSTFGHEDAVQMSNLYWRVRGYNKFYRNGMSHGTHVKLNKTIANTIPIYFRK